MNTETYKIQRRTSDATEKRYYAIFAGGDEVDWAADAEEAVSKATAIGATANNTGWAFKKRDIASFAAKSGPASKIGMLMIFGRICKKAEW